MISKTLMVAGVVVIATGFALGDSYGMSIPSLLICLIGGGIFGRGLAYWEGGA